MRSQVSFSLPSIAMRRLKLTCDRIYNTMVAIFIRMKGEDPSQNLDLLHLPWHLRPSPSRMKSTSSNMKENKVSLVQLWKMTQVTNRNYSISNFFNISHIAQACERPPCWDQNAQKVRSGLNSVHMGGKNFFYTLSLFLIHFSLFLYTSVRILVMHVFWSVSIAVLRCCLEICIDSILHCCQNRLSSIDVHYPLLLDTTIVH